MLEPLFQHIYLKEHQSYNIIKVDRPFFIVPWHLHPEIELMSITKGEGTRLIGDNIENYTAGDLVLVGSNLPHCWKSSKKHYESQSKCLAGAKVILFRRECFGDSFFDTPELESINKLLLKASQGICFSGIIRKTVNKKIAKAYNLSGAQRMMAFIDLLNDLAQSDEYRILSSPYNNANLYLPDMKRLNNVFDFLLMNYHKKLRLEDIAAKAFMSTTAFCRYFKTHTNKTVINFLTELRISEAKKMLINQNAKIKDVYYLCGFNNASNFYEQFKKWERCTPLQFKKKYENQLNELINLSS